jgi:uncharacterized membrane protein YoaK (UPF0700 family)
MPLALTGMLPVIAMAVQNAAHLHLPSAPAEHADTGATAQIMLDLADLAHGTSAETGAPLRPRLGRMAIAVAAFGPGCGVAALLYTAAGVWCVALSPLEALASLSLALSAPASTTA